MPRWSRVVLPVVLIVVWLALAGVGGPFFGKVSEVSSNDQASYLPASADATQVADLQAKFSGADAVPAIVVYERQSGLSRDDLAAIADDATSFADLAGVHGDVSPPVTSKDGKAAEVFVPLADDSDLDAHVAGLRAHLKSGTPQGVESYVTGPAGFTADLVAAFGGIDGILLAVALAAVFVILVIVYRSPLLPVLVLATSMFALCVALLVVWWLAKWGIVQLNGQVQGILFILVIGAATDYSLLYVSRYREALRDERSRWQATWKAVRGAFGPVVASAGTVIVGLLCLLFSDLNSNKALGPVASIGIAFAFLAAMTFLPSVLMAFGRAAFWPVRPKFGSDHPQTVGPEAHGLWARVSAGIRRAPRVIWIVCTVALLAGATGLLQLKAEGVPQSDIVLGHSDARDGQKVLADHFPGGSGSPALVVGPRTELQPMADLLLDHSGVSSVAVSAKDSPSGSAPVTKKGAQPLGPPGTPAPDPTVVDGDVMLQATLTHPADSDAAESTVRSLRADLSKLHAGILVGGVTAVAVDSNDASIHDRNTIIPIVLLVILVILMLLLRAIVAPVILVLSVVVSFAASLGVSAYVFNDLFRFPGADPAVPLYGFVFLVALGIDYNIFLMTRVREESLLHGTRQGILRGLAVTGGVITSAGLVLASTFAALGVIPILFLAQIAFIVAFGVLVDTLVVRSLLVPAVSYDIGRASWWPSRLWRTDGDIVASDQDAAST
ncbi:MMPL family transporter [Humibacter sp.]|jgi:RND superfamily putative drug exporter|uniref:MMPL family transporter n=1 Tax=Humibacter sp. TaxID=1940291 RepID=UPI002B9E14BF|nr:efflux RND transporter permease subunit [Humibacter sp.]HVX08906.1 efflux RND transporter permease subunit [Humibacter sp.]